MTGAHDLHKTAGYGDVPDTGCDYCHNDGGSKESHPNSINNVSTNASASIATYTEVVTSGNDDTCVGASCHSNGLTAGAIAGTTVWDTNTAGACDTCHSNDASGLPVTGDHSAHYTAENYLCEVCHGADSDNGTNPGHKTNASIDMDFTGSLASGGTINAGTCDVYCHSPNPNDFRPNPTWNVSTVGCTDCHSNPPATTRNSTAHTASAACDDCHGTDSATGNHSGHIDGLVDISAMICESCHGQPANGTAQPNMTGAHDLHATAGYGDVPETGCDYCHNDGGNYEPHPNSINNVSTNASASIATYTEVVTSGNDDTCVGASCHSNGLTAGAIAGTTVWDTNTAGACDTCHSNDASGLPVTGDHSAHYTAENYLCEVCHGADSDNGTNPGHKTNASIDMDFTGSLAFGGTINAGTCDVYCHSPNPNDFRPNPDWGVSAVVCGDCHTIPPTTTRGGNTHTSNMSCDTCHGSGAANGTQPVHVNGVVDSGAMSCDACHAQPPSGQFSPNMTGAHDLHKTAGYGTVPETSCDYCHSTGGLNEPHPSATTNVVTNASVSIQTYTQNTTSGKDDTCIGASCHSNGLTADAIAGTTVWDTATIGACDTCHSDDLSGLPVTGDHSAHYTAENYLCEVCHGADSNNGTNPGHKTNASIDMDFTGSLASGGTINAGTCDVYCHSPNPNDFRPNPTWNVSTVGCIDCHSNPPATTRNGTAHTASAACDDCHGTDATTGNHSGHIDGLVDIGAMTCDSCHGQPANGTARPNMTGAHDLHKTAGYGDVPETGCDYCHNDGGYNETHPNSINNVSTNA
ncbi:MAG: CxxxxCH/CxxCH domain-containing protein, partial [Methanosarcinales archaeon]|nr:CxxxxCH/CxxCH domain-containing protein [Methanosarcinales archaeon]